MFLLLKHFLKKSNSSGSTGSPGTLILEKLRESGYSPMMARNWVAVSNFETGKWTSKLYREAHNLFGMRQPMQRYTLSTGPTASGFSTFRNDQDSVLDLIAYMEYFNYPKDFPTLLDQVTFMKEKRYFEEPLDQYYFGVKSRAS